MPMLKGKSEEARQKNIEREIAAGHPPKQAVAMAYEQQRRGDTSMCDDFSKAIALAHHLKK